MKKVVLYTDGACKTKSLHGGWGYYLEYTEDNGEIISYQDSGNERNSTNNKMELTAVIKGLEKLTKPCEIDLYSDSQYVVKGINEWLKGWIRNNWVNSLGEPVKNQELWKIIVEFLKDNKVNAIWVKAHNGNEKNELVDNLADLAANELYNIE